VKVGLYISLLIFSMRLSSQDKPGISNSNHSPSNSVFLNASSTADSRVYMQANLVGLNVFVINNMSYLPQFSIWEWRKTREVPRPLINENKLPSFFYAYAEVLGPAFYISYKNFGAGLFTRARSILAVNRLPHQLTSLLMMQDPVGPNQLDIDLTNARFVNMSWAEYGGNFSYIFHKRNNVMMVAGANVKYLTGINLAYGLVNNLQGNYNDTVIDVQDLTGRVSYNTPSWNSGSGAAIDLGFTYKHMLSGIETYFPNSTRSNCKKMDYLWKLGVSLRDVGFIRFTKNVSSADFSGSGYFYTDRNDVSYRPKLETTMNTVIKNDPVTAFMPAALAAQLDYNLGYPFYLNLSASKNLLPKTFTGAPGPDYITLTPRFETSQIEVSLPLSLQHFIRPQIGIAFRIRSLVVGVDNLVPLIVMANTFGVGVYFSLGITLFRNPACRTCSRSVDGCVPTLTLKTEREGFFKRLFKRKR
jgi:hypothetical protein